MTWEPLAKRFARERRERSAAKRAELPPSQLTGRQERCQWALELYVRGTPRRSLAAAIREHWPEVGEKMSYNDIQHLFRRMIPRLYPRGSFDERIQIAASHAESALREAWDELRALQRGDYDAPTKDGLRRPPSPPYVSAIIAAQRHLAELMGVHGAGQQWNDRKRFEELKSGALAQLMAEVGSLTDDELRAEAIRLATDAGPSDDPGDDL